MNAERDREETARQAGARVLAGIGALAGRGPLTRIGADRPQQEQPVRPPDPLEEVADRVRSRYESTTGRPRGSIRRPQG
jgi:hypothetical protein